MNNQREMTANARKKDLEDKYLACDPLPDPENEKDLTTFVALWKQSKDKTLAEALHNSQTAQDVVSSLKLMYGEAMAQQDFNRMKWCEAYFTDLQEIILQKFDDISVDILTYFEKYMKFTEEEKEAILNDPLNNKTAAQLDIKEQTSLIEKSKDLMFGIWCNSGNK